MNDDTAVGAISIGFFVLLFVAIFGFGFIKAHTKAEVTDKIVKTERIVDSGVKSSKYLIFGSKETYEDTDSLWYWKWNSSDVYGALQSGKTYEFTVIGWRIPFLSWYRNIVKYKEVK